MIRQRLYFHPRVWAIGASLLSFLIGMAPRPLAAQEKLDLVPRFDRGDVHRFRVTLDQVINQRTRQTTATTYTFTVEDADEQGSTLSIRYDSLTFHATTPAGRVDYDSANPPGLVPPEVSGMAALVGQGYSVHIDPRGNVTQVMGVDKLLAAILSKLTIPQGGPRMAFEKSLRRQLDDRSVRANLQVVFVPWADHPISIGESWTQKEHPVGGFPITVDSTYTLVQRENGIWEVALKGRIATAPMSAIDMKPMSLSYDLAGTERGRLQISSRTGWLSSAEISQKLTGSATLRSPNAAPETVPMAIQTTMKVEQK